MSYQVRTGTLSYDEAARLYPDLRYEIHDGVLIAKDSGESATHQRVIGQLLHMFLRYTDGRPEVGEVFVGPLDVKLRGEAPAIVLQPDVLFVASANTALNDANLAGPPDIAIEIVSPSSIQKDVIYKRNRYATFGVPEYWIIWPEERLVDVLRLEGKHYVDAKTFEVGETLTTPILPGFALPIGQLFKTLARH